MIAPSSAAPAVAASHPKVSSLQQLLALKNRVLMELQRHGIGSQPATHPGTTAGAPAGAPSFAARPASGSASAAAAQSRAAAAANQRFIGVGGYGFSLARNQIPAVAAIAAAVVAALLVLLIALGLGRRGRPKQPKASVPGSTKGSPIASPSAEGSVDAAQTAAAPAAATDDPIEAEYLAILARTPSSKRALMGLAAHYAERKNAQGFDEIAQRIYRLSGGRGPNWTHVAAIGRQLDPDNPLYALDTGETDEAVLAPRDEAVETPAPAPEAAAPPVAEEGSSKVAPAAAEGVSRDVQPPLVQAAQPASPSDVPLPTASADAGLPSSEAPTEASGRHEADLAEAGGDRAEDAPPAQPETHKAEAVVAPVAPEGEPTLPPEAVAALDGLDFGLPPRVAPAAESAAHGAPEHEAPPRPDERTAEPAPIAEAAGAAEPAEPTESAESAESAERGEVPAHAPAAPPAVTGLGAAPVGRLALSFDLDLPGGEAGEGQSADCAPLPQFTPEQLARIARNKLDLATEYIELGDLGGARTLIHEVIESNDPGTHDEAHALLATLAPLS